jgi:energy-converting hydrogenase Eha subunit A
MQKVIEENTANSGFQILLARFIVVSLFIGVMATIWDVWWHGFMGRDTLFEPPHIFLYTFVGAAIIAGVYGWYRIREKMWKRLAIILLIVPASAPFDELWHRLYGVENFSTPLIIWAPPHIALVSAIIISWILLLPLLNKEKDVHARRLFGSLVFAAILISTLGMAAPFQPIGPYHVLGFWGAGILAAIFSGILLTAQKWISGIGSAITVAAFFLLIYAVGLEPKVAPLNIIIPPHDHPPAWLIVFSFLTAAALADFVKQPPHWLRGALMGLVWAGILYGFAYMFMEPEFQYTITEIAQALGTSLLGGTIGGLIASRFSMTGK